MQGGAKRLCALGGGSDNAAIFRHAFKELGLQKLDQRKKKTNRAERLYRRWPQKYVGGSRRAHRVRDK